MGGAIRMPWASLLLVLLTGCQTASRTIDNDPLVGDAPSNRSTAARRDEVMPIPPANTPTSPAALTVAPIKPARESSVPSKEANAPSAGVTLGGPRPKAGSTPVLTGETTSRTRATDAATAEDSYESLQQRLKAVGVVWQQIKMVDHDRWDYCCAIENPHQPNVRRNYEARSRATAIEAMREVLNEIEAERR